ncbi:hypothetical protein B0H13DRAFT_2304685 [Mycena leptocephala]|nr:hypothetical protein B0H13DRAFT_2304685 [Mycena leptocephala]
MAAIKPALQGMQRHRLVRTNSSNFDTTPGALKEQPTNQPISLEMNLFDACKLAAIAWSVMSFIAGAGAAVVPVVPRESCTNCQIGIKQGPSGEFTLWTVDDESLCSSITIDGQGGNPCSVGFPLDNQPGEFTIEGCGGDLWATVNGTNFGKCPPVAWGVISFMPGSAPVCEFPDYICTYGT